MVSEVYEPIGEWTLLAQQHLKEIFETDGYFRWIILFEYQTESIMETIGMVIFKFQVHILKNLKLKQETREATLQKATASIYEGCSSDSR
jgi:hypothetical protein